MSTNLTAPALPTGNNIERLPYTGVRKPSALHYLAERFRGNSCIGKALFIIKPMA